MTKKRFTIKPQDNYFGITDNNHADKMNVINGIHTEIEAKWLCDLMNELNDEKKELQFQCNLLREQSNEFHRRAIENANRVGQLEKENKELKDKLENGLCPLCGARVSKCGGLQKYKGDLND